MTGDINSLVGRHFVSKSGNVARVSRLGDGAARVTWRIKATAADIEEFEAWALAIIARAGFETQITRAIGIENEAPALAKWKRKL